MFLQMEVGKAKSVLKVLRNQATQAAQDVDFHRLPDGDLSLLESALVDLQEITGLVLSFTDSLALSQIDAVIELSQIG